MWDHLEAILALGSALVAIVGSYVTVKVVLGNNVADVKDLKDWKDKHSNVAEELKDLKRWKEDHERMSARKQGEYEGKISTLEKQLAVGDFKFIQVAKDIDEIKSDMKTLLGRRRQDREEEDNR